MYILWNIMILCLFLLQDKVSHPVSHYRKFRDASLVAPVTMRAALIWFFKLVCFVLCAVVPHDICVFQ